MRQNMGADIFAWILGLGSLASGAVGAVLILAPPAPRLPPAVAAAASHPPAPPPPAAMQAPRQSSPHLAATAAASTVPDDVAPALLNKAIWQCEVKGQKIFADFPCGRGASLRSLNETNRMMPTPIVPRSAYAHDEPSYTETFPEEIQSVPGNPVYLARPVYRRRWPMRPPRATHPGPRGAPRPHGM